MFSRVERMVALRYLRAKKKEGFISIISVFSVLGIMLGVAILIVVMSVMNGFRADLLDRILGINAHLTISSATYETLDKYDELATDIKAIDGVEDVSAIVTGQLLVSAGNQQQGSVVKGITIEDLRKKTLVSENIVAGDLNRFEGTNAVIIGSKMANILHVVPGDTISLISPQSTNTFMGAIPRLKEYLVVGLFEVGMFEYDSSTIFMPLEAAQLYFDTGDYVHSLEIMLDDPETVNDIMKVIDETVEEPLRAVDWQQVNAHFFNALDVERNVMFLILTSIIVIAAFIIITGMIMLVNDKGKAIAIMRTMGATKGMVMRIFFMCGSAIGFVGTFLGFLLGVGFASNIQKIREWLEAATDTTLFAEEIYFLATLPSDVKNEDVIYVVAMALGVSFLATLYPAWRASRIEPVEGIRYE